MYLNTGHSLLGTTEEEEAEESEDDVYNVGTNDENSAPVQPLAVFGSRRPIVDIAASYKSKSTKLQGTARKVVNRLLWEAKNTFQELHDWNAFAPIAEEGSEYSVCDQDDVRPRFFSDSDLVFETQRKRRSLDGCRVDEFGFQVLSPRETFSLETSRSRAHSDSFLQNPTGTSANSLDTPAARSRSVSENYVTHWEIDSNIGIQHSYDFDFDKIPQSQLFVESIDDATSLHPLKLVSTPSSGSGPSRRTCDETPVSMPRLGRKEVSKSHRRLSSNPEFSVSNPWKISTPSPKQWNAWSAYANTTFEHAHVNINSNAFRESTNKPVTYETCGAMQEIDPRRGFQSGHKGITSPTAASAAKIIASALRPPNTSMESKVTSVTHNQNYYWNDGSDDESVEEVLWKLSPDVSFESLF